MNRVQCYKCGRFVGKDGFIDVTYDYYMGGWEEGYSECGKCRSERWKREDEKRRINKMTNEIYYLISKSDIDAINSNIVVLNKAAQFMKNEGFESFSEAVNAYGVEIGVLINNTYKCNVCPINGE